MSHERVRPGPGQESVWDYPRPPRVEASDETVALMPGLVDRCTVDGEDVVPQAGGFYGGWITSRLVGPFTGEPVTRGW